ncbi:5-(carboxyamino)imidazole ribonucleotide mutase [Pontimonas sp.]|nr:5-(carboxyamino)imidazole ribonucleotide mutase [Pontimonas sp.]
MLDMKAPNKVAVIMGSDSDWPIMREASEILVDAGVDVDSLVVSAHRTPEKMMEFAKGARSDGYVAIIAGAGGAAHLPGMVASLTTLPVIGVPIPLSKLDGMDSLLSIVQMPSGVPVAAVGIGQAKNAGLLALRFISLSHPGVADYLNNFADSQEQSVLSKEVRL